MLKLALNKSLCASDYEQGISKLWPESVSVFQVIRNFLDRRTPNELRF